MQLLNAGWLTPGCVRHSPRGDFRSWHQTDMPTVFRDVRFQGQSGKHLLVLGISPFDPFETSAAQQ
jgi:hypothetical protein